LLRFVSTRYDQIVVDLPEVINDATAEAIECSRCVYVVATPELPSLRLVEQRVEDLNTTEMENRRIRLLLNRMQHKDPKPDEIAESLGLEVDGVFPNDYPTVKRSILESQFVSPHSDLGTAFRLFAGSMLGRNPAPMLPKKQRNGLLDMFRREPDEEATVGASAAKKRGEPKPALN
jgi:Flp pilus assembly CpaE family ATPase